MAKNLYRSSSGIYAVRICVPADLKQQFGCGEMHISTGLTDIDRAEAQAFAILTRWQQRVVELRTMDVLKISEGSALFAGDGLIRLSDVQQELSIRPASDRDR